MHCFHVAGEIDGDTMSISDAGQLHHIRDVLRLKVNDEVVVFDGRGNECYCRIKELDQQRASLDVRSKRLPRTGEIRLFIACAIPKAGMDGIVDSLTQLGVDGIIPMETERIVVRLDDAKKEARLERWRRIARSAAQQSQRSTIPVVESVTGIKSVIAGSRGFNLKLIPALSGERKYIKEVLAGQRPNRVLVLIGPEGDFTPGEITLAESAGFIPVSLGDLILRVNTAAIAVASYFRLALAETIQHFGR